MGSHSVLGVVNEGRPLDPFIMGRCWTQFINVSVVVQLTIGSGLFWWTKYAVIVRYYVCGTEKEVNLKSSIESPLL